MTKKVVLKLEKTKQGVDIAEDEFLKKRSLMASIIKRRLTRFKL